jgi:hypothetical protein
MQIRHKGGQKMTSNDNFTTLRTAIRQSTTQFRYANDNSKSLLKPESGYAYAYNIAEVETALACYEVSLDPVLPALDTLSKAEKIIQMGSQICANCTDDYAREFAQTVVAHFIGEEMERSGQILELLAGDSLDDETEH